MPNIGRSIKQARDAQVILGVQKDLQDVSTLPLGGSKYTMPALEELLQSRIDAANAILTKKADWLDAVATYQVLDARVTKVVRGLRQYALNAFGEDSPTLADFGFSPPKKATLTPEQKTVKAARAKATREARNTMGKKQKKGIKGTVTATLVVPPQVDSPPTVTAPAPVAPGPRPSAD